MKIYILTLGYLKNTNVQNCKQMRFPRERAAVTAGWAPRRCRCSYRSTPVGGGRAQRPSDQTLPVCARAGVLRPPTCRPNSRCRRPCLGGGEGCPLQSRSGGTVPSWWKTFSSAKQPVSTICGAREAVFVRAVQARRARLAPRPAPRSARGWTRCLWTLCCRRTRLWAPAPRL